MSFRSLHKWLMLFLGLQFLIWSGSGLYMVLMDIHFIHGETIVKRPKLNLQNPIVINQNLGTLCGKSAHVKVVSQLGSPVLVCQSDNGVIRYDLSQNKTLGQIDKDLATTIAKANLAAPAEIKHISFFEKTAPVEVSPRHLPFWRIEFDTLDSATLYISAHSGEVVTKRHTYWRVFDWMWRFHIMDYDDGENVKNVLLTIFLTFSLLATVAGLVLLVRRFGTKSKLSRPWFVKLHGVFAAVVGLQFLVWLLTGAFFNVLSGPDYSPNVSLERTDTRVDLSALPLLEVPNVGDSQRLSLTAILGQPFWVIERNAPWHDYQLKSAEIRRTDSHQVVKLNEEMVQRIAQSSYRGEGEVTAIELVSNSGSDFPQQQNPYWRVKMTDDNQTWIFVDSQTGAILKHSTEASRFKDLMLKLHFMDYFNQGGFNHSLIYIFALVAMAQALTGAIWTVKLMKGGQFRLQRAKRAHSLLVGVNTAESKTMALTGESSLFSALKNKGIILPSSCDGAGTCGHCVSRLTPSLTPTPADTMLISPDKIAQGYRLACQHDCEHITHCRVKSVKP